MKRYISISTDLWHETSDDRMAELPVEAVRRHFNDVGEKNFSFVEHQPEALYRLGRNCARTLFSVYEVPGEPLEGGIRTDEHIARLIESLFKPVSVIECVERPNVD